MKKTTAKQAVQVYKKNKGNFVTQSTISLKKESDLSSLYYPGIEAVLEKIENKPELLEKMSTLQGTVLVVSTRPTLRYPLLTAKAALITEVAQVNALPLQLSYSSPKKMATILQSLEQSACAIFIAESTPKEREILEATYKGRIPLLFHEESEAAAVVSAVLNSAKLLKKSLSKTNVTLHGDDSLAQNIIRLLKENGVNNLTLVDDRGALYKRRPNMNRFKKALLKLTQTKKDSRTLEEIYKDTHIFITTEKTELKKADTELFSEKAVFVTLKAQNVELQKSQSLVSTMPDQANHITDLHIAAGIFYALSEGKKITPKTLKEAIFGLQKIYKAPQKKKIVPGLLEKNLAKKISSALS